MLEEEEDQVSAVWHRLVDINREKTLQFNLDRSYFLQSSWHLKHQWFHILFSSFFHVRVASSRTHSLTHSYQPAALHNHPASTHLHHPNGVFIVVIVVVVVCLFVGWLFFVCLMSFLLFAFDSFFFRCALTFTVSFFFELPPFSFKLFYNAFWMTSCLEVLKSWTMCTKSSKQTSKQQLHSHCISDLILTTIYIYTHMNSLHVLYFCFIEFY